ncbi:MAG: SET domain-containing protein-lysine N-methyltransferase [Cyclobacteriaceae bacterium]
MAFLEKFLYTKRSQLPKSGLGLFTRIKIPKGACIVEYKGRLQKWGEVKHQDGYNGYLLRVNKNWAINALSYKKALGRFANDAMGLCRSKDLSNNAEYLLEGRQCFIYAKKDIYPGEEILVSYGTAYWNLIRRIAKTAIS